jgi:hypothetical protein
LRAGQRDARRVLGCQRRAGDLLAESLDLLLLLSDLFLLLRQRLLQSVQLLLDGGAIARSERRRRDERSEERRMRDAQGRVGHDVLLNVAGSA